jgi:branched-chain amino acid transport system ATP-binding protein
MHKSFGGVAAVDGASFDVAAGSITSLIGPNGAGKSTAFNLIAGFYRLDSGQVWFKGQRTDGWRPHRIARAGLLRTFQQVRVMPHITVLENVLIAAPDHPGEHLGKLLLNPRAARRYERDLRAQAKELLKLVRLEHLAGSYASALSGGQRKLLEFARVLLAKPDLVLLDEPMAGVNPALGLELLDHIERFRAERGTTFLLVEHDLEAVMRVSDTIHVMGQGKVIASGTPDEIRAHPQVIDAYLGTQHEPEVAAGSRET